MTKTRLAGERALERGSASRDVLVAARFAGDPSWTVPIGTPVGLFEGTWFVLDLCWLEASEDRRVGKGFGRGTSSYRAASAHGISIAPDHVTLLLPYKGDGVGRVRLAPSVYLADAGRTGDRDC